MVFLSKKEEEETFNSDLFSEYWLSEISTEFSEMIDLFKENNKNEQEINNELLACIAHELQVSNMLKFYELRTKGEKRWLKK